MRELEEHTPHLLFNRSIVVLNLAIDAIQTFSLRYQKNVFTEINKAQRFQFYNDVLASCTNNWEL